MQTELYFGQNLLTEELLLNLCGNLRPVLISDEAICSLYAVDLAKKLRAELLTIPSGERAKSEKTAFGLIHTLCKMGASRDTLLIAIGGGATTDLVGFVASIYMRGIPLILIPTTLLAMVDASIGGKTAINAPCGKNLIGTIHHPKAIIADFNLLQSLPEKQWFNGLAEILKIGLVFEPAIWKMAEKNRKAAELVVKAIEAKRAVVKQDPKEQSVRRILNFGHTIGHALESVSRYKMSHGEAVAIGCVAEAYLSMCLGYLGKNDFKEIQDRYGCFSLKLPKGYTRNRLLSAMAHDKKKALGEIRFVLIDQIGHAADFDGSYCRSVTEKELKSTLDWMER